MKTVAIVQARTGSTRLPNKVLKKLMDKTVLGHDIERLKQSKKIDEIVIATTLSSNDDPIVKEALKYGVRYFRGSEDDVLSRYYWAAKENASDLVVRVTSDCPLIDPIIADQVIDYYLNNDFDIVTNAGNVLSERTYPRGLDVEVFSFAKLEEAFNNASKQYEREHVTPYIYETSQKVYYYKNNIDYSKYRWTLDTDEDYALILEVYKALYNGEHNFYFKEILQLFIEQPQLALINAHIEQKKVK